MNFLSAFVGTVIFTAIFGVITYVMERRKLVGDPLASAVRGALIAGAVYFVLTLVLQQFGYV